MAELAEDLRLSVAELEAYLQRGAGCISLDLRVGQGNNTMVELISNPDADPPDYDRMELMRRLEAWEERGDNGRLLHPTAHGLAQLIRAAWGIDRQQETARELGARLGLSRYQVGARLRKAVRALKADRIPPEDGTRLELGQPAPPACATAPAPSAGAGPAQAQPAEHQAR